MRVAAIVVPAVTSLGISCDLVALPRQLRTRTRAMHRDQEIDMFDGGEFELDYSMLWDRCSHLAWIHQTSPSYINFV